MSALLIVLWTSRVTGMIPPTPYQGVVHPSGSSAQQASHKQHTYGTMFHSDPSIDILPLYVLGSTCSTLPSLSTSSGNGCKWPSHNQQRSPSAWLQGTTQFPFFHNQHLRSPFAISSKAVTAADLWSLRFFLTSYSDATCASQSQVLHKSCTHYV